MKKELLTDEQIQSEIERLKKSEAVKLAQLEQQIKYRRRQYLYQLRWLEKHGKELMEAGITAKMLKAIASWEE